MAKRKPRRAKAAKGATKRSTRARAAKTRKKKKTAARPSARTTARKAARKATRRAVAPKTMARKTVKRAAKKKAAKKKRAPAAKAPAIAIAPVRPARAAKAPRPKRAPTLDRARKTVGEDEPHGVPSSLDMDQRASAARSGHRGMAHRLKEHTSTGPAITAGDVDADWQEAESIGDEAPGGDNPTPDQDVVEEIGRALGVEYEDGEELKGGDEIASRDRHRWELDPASSDDYDERD